jgi:transcription-repair coupling factor (superfamily II helicase)
MTTLKHRRDTLIDKAVEGVSSTKAGERCVLRGLFGSSKAYELSKTFKKSGKPILAVLPTEAKAREFSKDLEFFLGKSTPVLYYPTTEQIPFDFQPTHPDIIASRAEFLYNLTSPDPDNKPFIAVTAVENLLEKITPKESFTRRLLRLSIGDEVERSELLSTLTEMGYRRMELVEERGEMSVRGGIIDIFPPPTPDGGSWPLRLEFIGDEIESLRLFDPTTQRSQRELTDALIMPTTSADLSAESRQLAREALLNRAEDADLERNEWQGIYDKLLSGGAFEGADTLLPLFFGADKLEGLTEYLPKDTLLALVSPSAINAEARELAKELKERSAERRGTALLVHPEELFINHSTLTDELSRFCIIEIEDFGSKAKDTKSEKNFEIQSRSNITLTQNIRLKKDLSPLKEQIRKWLSEGVRVFITAHNHGQAERTAELLEDFQSAIVPGSSVLDSALDMEAHARVSITEGSLKTGFHLPEEALVIVTEEELFGERTPHRAPPKKKLEGFINQLRDLNEGDPIVHTLHGIGIYRGLKRISHGESEGDFMLLTYASDDKLYLPVQRMDQISKFHALEGQTPRLDKLGTNGWEKTKGKVKKAVESIAGELLKLYAKRELAEGTAFSPTGKLFGEFEAAFEYEETPDQARAIEEVLADMSKKRPMDRLVCGDVGYGKTEVAMRAAFRAVLDSKQVAILVPTTVLAQQHYLSFKERFAPFPVNVEVISRFKSKKEQQEILERLSNNADDKSIDILIGTHRLLQKDIRFKDLGLLVVDEEQRFGVKNKERIKELRSGVDVLTLTATPIPRTLNMSFTGLRDLSIINTPPEDRLAIATRVIRFDELRIKEAIERELRRGGQIFFVHNRVQSIGAMRTFVERIAGEVKEDVQIAIGHGQMRENELEKVMLGFVGGDIDILLSTTIIESGLDIPRANTIIINRADRFGLSELYQLRGRVGRSNHRAYAYLISPEPASLTPEARKRMEVISELSELGSGFRIAAYDLEIRGAGELLGSAQSGKIKEVGFEMYSDLLKEAVDELRGIKTEVETPAEVNLKISQFIDDDYVPETRQRLSLYKRLALLCSIDELTQLSEEMRDRYGELPAFTENLLMTTKLKITLKTLGATELSDKGGRLYVTFSDPVQRGETHKDVTANALRLTKDAPEQFRLTPDLKLVYRITAGANIITEARYLLQELSKR